MQDVASHLQIDLTKLRALTEHARALLRTQGEERVELLAGAAETVAAAQKQAGQVRDLGNRLVHGQERAWRRDLADAQKPIAKFGLTLSVQDGFCLDCLTRS